MNKRLFNAPTTGDIEFLADFAELCCIRDGLVSTTQLTRILNQAGEGTEETGIEDEEADSVPKVIDDAFLELTRRHASCGENGYPFEVEGDTLKKKASALTHWQQTAYIFMLVATRENMKSGRYATTNGQVLDGATMFEEFSSHVCHRLFTGNVADSASGYLLLGPVARATDDEASFSEQINKFCSLVNEGGGFRKRDPHAKPQDGGTDLVHWRTFGDRRACALVFGVQCKTGSTWSHDAPLNNQERFWTSWTHEGLLLSPIGAFCATRSISPRWETVSNKGALVLDRCRLTEYWGPFWWEKYFLDRHGKEADLAWRERSWSAENLLHDMRVWTRTVLKRAQES